MWEVAGIERIVTLLLAAVKGSPGVRLEWPLEVPMHGWYLLNISESETNYDNLFTGGVPQNMSF